MRMYIEGLKNVLDNLDLKKVKYLVSLIEKSDNIWIIGNGGSMSSACHIAEDIVKMIGKRATAISDASLLSMSANDEGLEDMFLFPLKVMTRKNDLVIGITTSGQSKNILRVIECKGLKCKKFMITGVKGLGCKVEKILIPCNDTQMIEDVSLVIGHLLCRFAKGVKR